MTNNLGRKITSLRNEQNITQEQLAEMIGVTRQAISKWERGDGLPDLHNTTYLAQALKVSVDELLSNSTNPNVEESLTSSLKKGGYLSKLLYKAKTTTNSEEAKKIRNGLLITGGIGVILGFYMIISGFVGFGQGAMDSVNNFSTNPFGTVDTFNPMKFMLRFLGGGVVLGVSSFLLYGGITLTVAGVASNYLDTRKKCPDCGDEVDGDELMCSNCGRSLVEDNTCKSCGNENQPGDNFCRACGESTK